MCPFFSYVLFSLFSLFFHSLLLIFHSFRWKKKNIKWLNGWSECKKNGMYTGREEKLAARARLLNLFKKMYFNRFWCTTYSGVFQTFRWPHENVLLISFCVRGALCFCFFISFSAHGILLLRTSLWAFTNGKENIFISFVVAASFHFRAIYVS